MKLTLSIMTLLMSGSLLAAGGGSDVGNSTDPGFQVASVKNLCLPRTETVLFSCSVVHDNKVKTVSVCKEEQRMNVHYRFGQQLDVVELKLSLLDTTRGIEETQAAEKNNYASSDGLSVKFKSGVYTYEVWSDLSYHGPSIGGLSILKNGKEISHMRCLEDIKSKNFDIDSLGNAFPFSDSLNK